MTDVLEWINLEDSLTLLVLIFLLIFIGGQMARPGSAVYGQARRLSAGTIVLYAALGIYAWGPSSAGDFVMILIRALFAGGVMFGTSLAILAAVHQAIGDPISAIVAKYRQWTEAGRRGAAEERSNREMAERQRRDREEAARRAPLLEQERQRKADEAARTERERHARTDEARAEVIRFYDAHADLLVEPLPPALLRSRLQNRFPASVAPEQAWQAAQEMIAEMLPLVAAAREQVRTEQEAARKHEEEAAEADRKRRKPDERREAIHRLTEWYEQEKKAIEERLPAGPERDIILHELYDRYDQLMKEGLRELTP